MAFHGLIERMSESVECNLLKAVIHNDKLTNLE